MKYKILYIHDFKFLIYEHRAYTSVGLPQEYFKRFQLSGVDAELTIISRSMKTNDKREISGYHLLESDFIKIKFVGIESYIILMANIFKSWRSVLSSDLIVINYPTINSLWIAILMIVNGFRTKYALEISGSNDLFLSKGVMGKIISWVHKKLILKLETRSAGVLSVANYLVEGFKNKNILIASNVIIKKRQCNNFECNSEKRIFFAGGLVERKGIQTIIEAAKILKNSCPQINIYLAGGHPDKNWESICETNNINNIYFLGILSKEEMIKQMEKSYIYVQPSIQEGLPRATIEAMAFGLPVIASKIPAFFEILSSESLIDVECHDQLAIKIKELVDDADMHRKLSRINFDKSLEYMDQKLNCKRRSFYEKIIIDVV